MSKNTVLQQPHPTQGTNPLWQNISFWGGAAALMIVCTALAEIVITYLPGGYSTADTVTDWFALLQNNPFMGLRNLGLLNIVMTSLGIPLTFALFWVHRKSSSTLAPLALILAMIGTAIFFSTNRAFPMLDLSAQYSIATTDAQKQILEASCAAMLAVGQSHSPGTFLAFAFSEMAGILIALVMLRGKLFKMAAVLSGLIGYGSLFIFEIFSSFVPSSHDWILIIAMVGGLCNVTWYILAGLRLFQIAKLDLESGK